MEANGADIGASAGGAMGARLLPFTSIPVIDIGAHEFMCMGAKPPFDHPHVYCDMGGDKEYVCPYCSTLYRHDPGLAPSAARPRPVRRGSGRPSLG